MINNFKTTSHKVVKAVTLHNCRHTCSRGHKTVASHMCAEVIVVHVNSRHETLKQTAYSATGRCKNKEIKQVQLHFKNS